MDEDILHMTHPGCDGEIRKLRSAIRLHQKNKNDDMLYAVLPEGPPYVELTKPEIVEVNNTPPPLPNLFDHKTVELDEIRTFDEL